MWDIMNKILNFVCQILINHAYVDLSKFIDIINLNKIRLRHVVAHNFIFSGPTCINLIKLHMASH
jgi:hypothetical protein